MTGNEHDRRSFLATSVLAGGALLGATGTAAGETVLEVRSDGSGDYSSLQSAILDAPSGATIEVAPGEYEGGNWVPAGKALTIRGDTGDDTPGSGENAPVIDGGKEGGAAFGLENSETAQPLTIEGFTMRNWGNNLNLQGEQDGAPGDGISTGYRSNLTVRDVSMDHIVGGGVALKSDGRGTSENVTVERCSFDSIAHTAIKLAAVDGATVRNNEITASDPVPDAGDVWWETGTPDGNPVQGIMVMAVAKNGRTARTEDVEVAGNRVVARFDAAGIWLFAYNVDGASAAISDVRVRGNSLHLQTGAEADLVKGENHGIKVSTNPGPEQRPASVREVEVSGNDVTGANHAYKPLSTSSRLPDASAKGGIENLTIRDNVAVDCVDACIAVTLERGELSGLDITDNEFRNCSQGVVLWSRGRAMERVRIRRNDFHRDDPAAADEYRYAVEPVAYGGDIRDVQVSGSAVTNHHSAVGAFALLGGRIAGLTVTDCVFEGNINGVLSNAYDEDSTIEAEVTRTSFAANQVGVITEQQASGSNLHVHRCDFDTHDEFAAENRSGIGLLDATCNYWGHPTGPTHESNRPGRGVRVSDGVDYDPLLPNSYTKVSENACRPAPGGRAKGGRGSGRDATSAHGDGGGEKRSPGRADGTR